MVCAMRLSGGVCQARMEQTVKTHQPISRIFTLDTDIPTFLKTETCTGTQVWRRQVTMLVGILLSSKDVRPVVHPTLPAAHTTQLQTFRQ